MSRSSTLPTRKVIRLADYDYHTPGAYFITLCVQHHLSLFGSVEQEIMHRNNAGEMIAAWWHRLSNKFPTLETDAFVVMPNHLHGIIILHEPTPVGADPRVRPLDPRVRPLDPRVRPLFNPHGTDAHMQKADAHAGASLPAIMQWLKTMTTNAYIKGVRQNGWPPFHGKLWQRSYYEHIVRDRRDLDRIRVYIQQNPVRQYFDHEHTAQPD